MNDHNCFVGFLIVLFNQILKILTLLIFLIDVITPLNNIFNILLLILIDFHFNNRCRLYNNGRNFLTIRISFRFSFWFCTNFYFFHNTFFFNILNLNFNFINLLRHNQSFYMILKPTKDTFKYSSIFYFKCRN